MGKRIEVNKGDRYGRYTIIKEVEKRNKKRYFLCECECGIRKEVRFVALRAGEIKSCGCLRDEQNSVASLSHGRSRSRLYRTWHGMKQRCLNDKSVVYKDYGARGITVCEEWINFEPFQDWAMKNGYEENLTIERIDVNGNYEPSNCEWITQAEQLNNTRRSRLITFEGKTMNLKQWSERLEIRYSVLHKRLSSGWSTKKAFSTPIPKRYRKSEGVS